MSRARNDVPKDLRARLTLYHALVTQLAKEYGDFANLPAARQPRALAAALAEGLALFEQVEASRLQLNKDLLRRSNAIPKLRDVALDAQVLLRASLPFGHPLMKQKFLRLPGGKHDIPVETKLRAVVLRRLTRIERRTMGKRQRAKLKAGGDFELEAGPKGIVIKPKKR
ncbi:MAG: hypothetical protein ACYCWW_18285 [Deltaproteobacteria bacterium]